MQLAWTVLKGYLKLHDLLRECLDAFTSLTVVLANKLYFRMINSQVYLILEFSSCTKTYYILFKFWIDFFSQLLLFYCLVACFLFILFSFPVYPMSFFRTQSSENF